MNDTTRRFKHSTAEAFSEERFKTMTHFTDNRYMFKEPKGNSRRQDWIVGIVIFACVFFAGYPIVKQGITIIETEMMLEEERKAKELQENQLAKDCQSWIWDEINPGVVQCFDDTGRKTKIARVI